MRSTYIFLTSNQSPWTTVILNETGDSKSRMQSCFGSVVLEKMCVKVSPGPQVMLLKGLQVLNNSAQETKPDQKLNQHQPMQGICLRPFSLSLALTCTFGYGKLFLGGSSPCCCDICSARRQISKAISHKIK